MLSLEQQKELRQVWGILGHRSDVSGVDIGLKYVGDERTSELAVRVHVAEKFPNDAVPKHLRVSALKLKMPTDVIGANPGASTGAIPPAGNRGQRHEYLHPGISIGRNAETHWTGTLAAIVTDNLSGETCLLSCWHVLDGTKTVDTPRVSQPAREDDLGNHFVGVLRRGSANEHYDAAIAQIDGGVKVQFQQHETSVIVNSAMEPSIGLELTKSGRSTGVTSGIVDGIGWYTYFFGGVYRRMFGFRIASNDASEISKGGDSGSLWYDPQSRGGVGLHVARDSAASSGRDYAVACSLNKVLDGLRISLKSG